MLALSLTACGSSSSGLLSGQEAASLNAALHQVRTALDGHDCTTAQSEAAALKSRIAQLPSSVNGTVRASLEHGATTVERLVSSDCPQTPTTAATQTTPPPATTTTTTTTTITTTAPPPPKKPKHKTTPATTPTGPGTTTGPGNSHGHGNGNGHGNGGGDGQGGGDPPSTTPTTQTTPTTP